MCNSYHQHQINEAIHRGLKLLGGVEQFFSAGEELLIKPNVLWGTDPQRCVVTNPSVFAAVVSAFKDKGVRLSYGDSPGGLQTAIHALKKSGFHAIAEEMGVSLGDFDHGRSVSFENGISSKRLHIANAVLGVDGMISISKLKSHGLTRMTGAVKNQFGCVPGIVKGEYHARFPDIYDFSQLLVDVARFAHARLYIMDAVFAMEGNGPQSGDPKKIGALLFSADPVALDTIACKIIDLDPAFVPTIGAGARSGLGNSDEAMIELLGDPVDPLIDKTFRVVRKPPVRVPRNRLLRQIRSSFTPRPVINSQLCTRCLRCVQVCPVDPKAVEARKKRVPHYDYRSCIRCFCCHEMCPSKAITIRTPLLKKLFPLATYISLFMASHINKKRTQ